MIKLLYLVISLCDLEFQHGYPNNSTQETSTQSHHSQTTLASSQRPYCFDPPAYRALPQYPCAASLRRPSTSCTSTIYPLPYLCCNGGVLEIQKMLEGAERKTCTLPTLRREMGSMSRHILYPTRKTWRSYSTNYAMEITAWEKCAMEGSTARTRTESTPDTQGAQWLRQQPQEKTERKEKERRGSPTVCSTSYASTMEGIRGQ